MAMSKKTMGNCLLLILFGVALNAALQHLNVLRGALDVALGVLSPLIIGLAAAFLISIPVKLLEKRLIRPRGTKALALQKKLQRPLSILISLLLILGAVALVGIIVAPQLVSAVSTIVAQLPLWVEQLKQFLVGFGEQSPELVEWINSLSFDWKGLQDTIMGYMKSGLGTALTGMVSVATSVFGTATSTILSFIIALSVVAQKEKLARQAQNLIYAFLPDHAAQRTVHIARRANQAFSGFFSAQVLESCILGSLVFLGMILFRFEHALLISVLVTVTSVIPIVGAFFSAIVGALLLLVTSGLMRALGFVAFFLILQQLEGNLIYPRVMGSNVGLPALWVLVAITLGGSALGPIGMLIAVPIFAVIYGLLRDEVHARRRAQLAKNGPAAADPQPAPAKTPPRKKR